mmetsp:Transcript_46073/g.122200  ORF Transcript_46073/g.122200 Transcript_46073/m.122200 type:complete len:102 (+) Transcript_46073:278-583(+)
MPSAEIKAESQLGFRIVAFATIRCVSVLMLVSTSAFDFNATTRFNKEKKVSMLSVAKFTTFKVHHSACSEAVPSAKNLNHDSCQHTSKNTTNILKCTGNST